METTQSISLLLQARVQYEAAELPDWIDLRRRGGEGGMIGCMPRYVVVYNCVSYWKVDGIARVYRKRM